MRRQAKQCKAVAGSKAATQNIRYAETGDGSRYTSKQAPQSLRVESRPVAAAARLRDLNLPKGTTNDVTNAP